VILLIGILLAVFVLSSPWSVVVIVAACLLEIGEIAFLRNWSKRIGRRTKATTGAEAMVGQVVEVVEECRPVGSVRIHGELWEARCAAGAARGDRVVVDEVDGLTLVVSPASASGPGGSGTPPS
jgi:membrane protein implicated in regulation of membrane protease activity